MKKILSAMTALILILSVLCAGALAEAADITGEWYASLFGISVTMSLNEDGSYVLQMDMEDEEPSEGTWEFDGAALVMDKGSDTEMTLTYDPEAVSFCAEQDGIEFLFTREMPVAFEAAPVRADAAIEEFAGAWTCTLIDAMGIQAPPEMMDMYAGVTIEGSSVTLAIPDLLSSEEVTVECTFADGALTAMTNSICAIQPGYGNTAPVQLELDPGMARADDGDVVVAGKKFVHRRPLASRRTKLDTLFYHRALSGNKQNGLA